MKKTLISVVLVMALALTGLATGCSKDTPEPVTDVPEVFAPNFDSAESAKMGSYMYNSRYLITDEYAYYGFIDNLYWSKSIKVENDKITKITSSDSEYKSAEITEFPEASYFTQSADGTIYFLSKGGEKLLKLHPGSESADIVFNPKVITLQIENEKIWYTRAGEDKFFCSGLDGKNEEKILDKAVYLSICCRKLLSSYQDDVDGESLHVYDIARKRGSRKFRTVTCIPRISLAIGYSV